MVGVNDPRSFVDSLDRFVADQLHALVRGMDDVCVAVVLRAMPHQLFGCLACPYAHPFPYVFFSVCNVRSYLSRLDGPMLPIARLFGMRFLSFACAYGAMCLKAVEVVITRFCPFGCEGLAIGTF